MDPARRSGCAEGIWISGSRHTTSSRHLPLFFRFARGSLGSARGTRYCWGFINLCGPSSLFRDAREGIRISGSRFSTSSRHPPLYFSVYGSGKGIWISSSRYTTLFSVSGLREGAHSREGVFWRTRLMVPAITWEKFSFFSVLSSREGAWTARLTVPLPTGLIFGVYGLYSRGSMFSSCFFCPHSRSNSFAPVGAIVHVLLTFPFSCSSGSIWGLPIFSSFVSCFLLVP
ncbi:hypothetical protein BS47DRAFT_1158014 [Hydnum rufescens UP504]|uniref:Uncharacterized protein n=1 Tax=Hydnum rufescens UP504 TaxID=1448309 RepID=A0A9P6B8P6_9AGAM|nr:hypothetical protein BS47DRAFT_1158014 [Hydnum rufescens UP504]